MNELPPDGQELPPDPPTTLLLLRELYARNDGNQSKTARQLGVSQGFVSNLLAGKSVGGAKLAEALARVMQIPLARVLGIEPLPSDADRPNRATACSAASQLLGITYSQAEALADDVGIQDDPPALFWFDQIRARHEARARNRAPAPVLRLASPTDDDA